MDVSALVPLLIILLFMAVGNSDRASAGQKRTPPPWPRGMRMTIGVIGILVIGVSTAFLLQSVWEQEERFAEAMQKNEERFVYWIQENSELYIRTKVQEVQGEDGGLESLLLCIIKTKDHEDEQWWFGSGCFGERPRNNMAYILTKQDGEWRWIPKGNS